MRFYDIFFAMFESKFHNCMNKHNCGFQIRFVLIYMNYSIFILPAKLLEISWSTEIGEIRSNN